MDDLINAGRPFTSAQALTWGYSRDSLSRCVTLGRLIRLIRGVYVDARRPDSRALRIEAVSLVLPREAILCGDTAAWVLGIDTFAPGERFSLKPQCLVPHGAPRSRSAYVDCREAHVDPSDVMRLGSVRLTTPLRIASDLLRSKRRPYALSAAGELVRLGPVDSEDLRAYVHALKGYPGIRQARDLSHVIDDRCESAGEAWVLLRIADAGLPRPTPQWTVFGHDGELVARLDFAYPDLRIAIEYDGRDFHSSLADRQHDERRRAKLRALGWRIIVVDQDSTLGRDPELEITLGQWLNVHPSLPRLW
ncbi:DUF559 domain-containing protein [soil metagenome]